MQCAEIRRWKMSPIEREWWISEQIGAVRLISVHGKLDMIQCHAEQCDNIKVEHSSITIKLIFAALRFAIEFTRSWRELHRVNYRIGAPRLRARARVCECCADRVRVFFFLYSVRCSSQQYQFSFANLCHQLNLLLVFHCCPWQSDWSNRACMAADKSEQKLSPLPDTSFFAGRKLDPSAKRQYTRACSRSMFTCEWIPAMRSYNQSTAQLRWDLRNFIALMAGSQIAAVLHFQQFRISESGSMALC